MKADFSSAFIFKFSNYPLLPHFQIQSNTEITGFNFSKEFISNFCDPCIKGYLP